MMKKIDDFCNVDWFSHFQTKNKLFDKFTIKQKIYKTNVIESQFRRRQFRKRRRK